MSTDQDDIWSRLAEPLPWRMPMPSLVLQPLLENAVLHGVSRLPGGGEGKELPPSFEQRSVDRSGLGVGLAFSR